MIFWQEEDPIRRLEMLREARQGGSVTRPYAKLLRTHEAQGRLEIRTFTQVEDASWDQDSERWTLRLGSTSGNGGGKVSGQTTPPAAATGTGTSQNEASSSEQVRHGDAPATTSESETCSYAPVDGPQRAELEPLKADFIVSATGSQLSFSSLPFMRDLSVSHPVREVGGLPVLTEDLQWGRELPFFCVGGYSALQVSRTIEFERGFNEEEKDK